VSALVRLFLLGGGVVSPLHVPEDLLRAADVRTCGECEDEPHEQGEEQRPAEGSDRTDEIDLRHRGGLAPRWPWVEVLLALIVLGWAGRAHAAEARCYDVDARLEGEVLTLDVRIEVTLSAGEDELRLWLYGDRLAVAPAAIDERSGRWIFPGEVSLGDHEALGVELDGAPVPFERVPVAVGRDAGGSDLVIAVPPGGAERSLRVVARWRIPERFGRLGRAHGETALFGPWYPLVVTADAAAPSPARHRVRFEAASGEVVLFDEASGRASPIGARAELDTRAVFVPAMAAARLERMELGEGEGRLVILGARPELRPPSPSAEGEAGLESLEAIDRAGLVHEAFAEVLATLRWLSIPLPAEVTLAIHRSRTELAARAPGVVLASDRIFEVFPLEVVREFHRRALVRAFFLELTDRMGRALETDADRTWARELRSAALLELDAARRSDVAERPEDLLGAFSFHPAVDSLLHAPQITFEAAYFGTLDGAGPFRDDPEHGRLATTGGGRMLESARDVLDERSLRRFVARLVRGRTAARAALARVVGREDADRWIARWREAGSQAVNYRLGAIESAPVEGGFRHRVEVIREGALRIEPVPVRIEDIAGNAVEAVWDGEGERGVVEVITPAARGRVSIDPRHRLPQSAEIAEGHPRADDATDLPFRLPIISAFSLDLLLSESDFTGLLEFALRRRYDLEHTVTVRLFRTVARTGGRVRYVHGFGPKVHTNRRTASLGGGLGVNHVEPFAGSPIGGWALDLDVSGGVDTRSYLYDPRGGFSLGAGLSATGTFREDGAFNVAVRGAARGGVLLPVGLRNVFAFVAGAGFSVNPSFDADRQGLGGRNALRGFANGEILGAGVVYGVLEHRLTALSDLAVNVLHLAWLREIQLAWWLGAGGAFDTTDGRSAVFALEAGAGLRFHYEYGGIQPGVLALDFGVPVSRFWDQPASDRVPLGFYLSFDQFY